MTDDETLATWGSGGAPSGARRRGDVVVRDAGPWSATVLELLRHLERAGVAGCPRVVGSGFAPDGRETVSFVEGTSAHPKAWPSDDDLFAIGALLRQVHDAAAGFAPASLHWRDWYGRNLRGDNRVIGHCDLGPWNVLKTADGTVALIDWEFAGPTDVITELAQAAWLNAQLHDDDIAYKHGLPGVAARAGAARALVDGYGLAQAHRSGLVEAMIDVAVLGAADEARRHAVTADSPAHDADGYPVQWATAWRARSAAWMIRNRRALEKALR